METVIQLTTVMLVFTLIVQVLILLKGLVHNELTDILSSILVALQIAMVVLTHNIITDERATLVRTDYTHNSVLTQHNVVIPVNKYNAYKALHKEP